MDWFSTPGHIAFIESVDNDFRQGCSIILQAPKSVQMDLIRALEKYNEQVTRLHWLPFEAGEGDPIVELAKLMYGTSYDKEMATIPSLYKSAEFQSSIVIVSGIDEKNWNEWTSFLRTFSHFNQNVPSLDRTSFLIITGTGPKPAIKREELLLKCRIFDGIGDPWDMMIYAYYLMKNSTIDSIKKQLVASLCTELSLWDYRLCAQLVNQPLETLLEPHSVLAEYARERGWDSYEKEPEIEEKWSQGISKSYCGINERHSAFLALKNEPKQIAYRLWKAEISVLFPQLEIKRQNLLHQFSHMLSVPHRDSNGALIDDLEDLDIGHIEFQLSRHPKIEIPLRIKLSALRRGRNALAHMEPLKPREAFQILSPI